MLKQPPNSDTYTKPFQFDDPLPRLTTEPHLKANPEAGLHNLADILVGQQFAHGAQQQRAQDLKAIAWKGQATGNASAGSEW